MQSENLHLDRNIAEISSSLKTLEHRNRILEKRIRWVLKCFSPRKIVYRVSRTIWGRKVRITSDQLMVVVSVALAIITFFELLILSNQTAILGKQNERLDTQNMLFEGQNMLIANQNDLITSQNFLSEAERRSAYVFMMGNVMDAINQELSNPYNYNNRLSLPLVGQIIALSNALTPYQFIVGDSLVSNPYSPERGLLLSFLLDSWIHTYDLNQILSNGNFTYSYGERLYVYHDTILVLNIQNSWFKDLVFISSQINSINCSNCNTDNIYFQNGRYADVTIIDQSGPMYLSIDSLDIRDCFFISDTLYLDIHESNLTNSFIRSNVNPHSALIKSCIRETHLSSNRISFLGMAETIVQGFNSINIIDYHTLTPTRIGMDTLGEIYSMPRILEQISLDQSRIDTLIVVGKVEGVAISGSEIKGLYFDSSRNTDLSINTSIVSSELQDVFDISGFSCFTDSESIEYLVVSGTHDPNLVGNIKHSLTEIGSSTSTLGEWRKPNERYRNNSLTIIHPQ